MDDTCLFRTQRRDRGRRPVMRASWVYQMIALLGLLVWFGLLLGGTADQVHRLGIWSWGLLAVLLGVQLIRRPALDSAALSLLVGLPAAAALCMLVSYFVRAEELVIWLRIAALVLIVSSIPLCTLAWLRQRLRRPTE